MLRVACICVLQTRVPLEGGDHAAAVLLHLQDGHLAGLVAHERVSRLHVKPYEGQGGQGDVKLLRRT